LPRQGGASWTLARRKFPVRPSQHTSRNGIAQNEKESFLVEEEPRAWVDVFSFLKEEPPLQSLARKDSLQKFSGFSILFLRVVPLGRKASLPVEKKSGWGRKK